MGTDVWYLYPYNITGDKTTPFRTIFQADIFLDSRDGLDEIFPQPKSWFCVFAFLF